MTDPYPANPWPQNTPAAPPAYPPAPVAAPASAVPASAVPVTGYPTATYPPAAYPPPPPAKSSTNPVVWVLTAVAAVLLIATGATGYLYADTSGKNSDKVADAQKTVDDRTAELAGLNDQLDDLNQQLDAVNEDKDDVNAELAKVDGCRDALLAFFQENGKHNAGTDTEADWQAAIDVMVAACDD